MCLYASFEGHLENFHENKVDHILFHEGAKMPLICLSRNRLQCIFVILLCSCGLFLYMNAVPCLIPTCNDPSNTDTASQSNEPLIFIGGYPRSGTTLMRVLLDVHPSVRCGPETHILPHILYLYSFKIDHIFGQLHSANITHELVDSIFVHAIRTLIHKTGPDAERLCAKDPFIDLCLKQLLHLFPKSLFLLMVRDGRAVTNSVLRRHIGIKYLDRSKPENVLQAWDDHYKHVLPACQNSSRCRVVRYEDLVLRPREQMKGILEWLGVPWDEVVLQHDQNMQEVKLPRKERSTSQVVFPIYTEALAQWSLPGSAVPPSLIQKSRSYEMLRYFGYASLTIPPVYGIPELEVQKRAQMLEKNEEFRKLFKL
ncbi:protein tyrosine sulfotransferase [Echinococcus multilocularis]|uniref:Protein-tyrosine sulfotransferase n=1 Tax=Echinococcus multilocularis TaxID=6211 RepID=A0A068YF48_ECHMU|nr:protein tyrosine sulfotransferase [Echinococcus multilocularis]